MENLRIKVEFSLPRLSEEVGRDWKELTTAAYCRLWSLLQDIETFRRHVLVEIVDEADPYEPPKDWEDPYED